MFLYIFCYFSQSRAGRNILSDKVSGFFSLRTASIARAGRSWEGLNARTFHVQLYSFTGSETSDISTRALVTEVGCGGKR